MMLSFFKPEQFFYEVLHLSLKNEKAELVLSF